jgi:hypothetical protein
MRRLAYALVTAATSSALLAVVLAGCGGSDKTSTTSATPNTVPAKLVGTYERTVKQGETGKATAGLWKIAIGPIGEFFLVSPGETGFFNSPVTIDGNKLGIPADPESGCTAPGTYTYALAGARPGGTLTFTVVSDDFCPDRAALLTSSPFTSTD